MLKRSTKPRLMTTCCHAAIGEKTIRQWFTRVPIGREERDAPTNYLRIAHCGVGYFSWAGMEAHQTATWSDTRRIGARREYISGAKIPFSSLATGSVAASLDSKGPDRKYLTNINSIPRVGQPRLCNNRTPNTCTVVQNLLYIFFSNIHLCWVAPSLIMLFQEVEIHVAAKGSFQTSRLMTLLHFRKI